MSINNFKRETWSKSKMTVLKGIICSIRFENIPLRNGIIPPDYDMIQILFAFYSEQSRYNKMDFFTLQYETPTGNYQNMEAAPYFPHFTFYVLHFYPDLMSQFIIFLTPKGCDIPAKGNALVFIKQKTHKSAEGAR